MSDISQLHFTNSVHGYTNILDWLESLLNVYEIELSKLSKALLIYWQIWNDRNKLIFRNIKPRPAQVLSLVEVVVMDFFQLNVKNTKKTTEHAHVRNNVVAGFVIRDEHGCPYYCWSSNLGENTIFIVGSFGVKRCSKICKAQGVLDD